jgi:hypothetical protein
LHVRVASAASSITARNRNCHVHAGSFGRGTFLSRSRHPTQKKEQRRQYQNHYGYDPYRSNTATFLRSVSVVNCFWHYFLFIGFLPTFLLVFLEYSRLMKNL